MNKSFSTPLMVHDIIDKITDEDDEKLTVFTTICKRLSYDDYEDEGYDDYAGESSEILIIETSITEDDQHIGSSNTSSPCYDSASALPNKKLSPNTLKIITVVKIDEMNQIRKNVLNKLASISESPIRVIADCKQNEEVQINMTKVS